MGAEKLAVTFLKACSDTSVVKSAKFMARQARDIEEFGAKEVYRLGVTEDIINAFTPFRRTSKRICSLSDPKYFIEEYEKLSKQLPINWAELSEAEKADFIVKERYGRLVANKIMNTIKNEPVEHHFSLSVDGEILSHDIGNDSHVVHNNAQAREGLQMSCSRLGLNIKGIEVSNHIDIHNHPHNVSLPDNVIEFLEKNNVELPKGYAPFSNADIAHYCDTGEVGYLIDSAGNKFRFTPHCLWKGDHSAADSVRSNYGRYDADIIDSLFNRMTSLYDKYKKLEESGASTERLNAAWEEALEAKTKFMTTMRNNQYRKEYLQSDLVKKYYGTFEEIA